jgi:hypothetical protein
MTTRPVRRTVRIERPEDPEGSGPIMGASEAAEALGVKQSNLRDLAGLPDPFQVLRMGSVWLRDDVLEFKADRIANPPKPGPKPTVRAKVAASG